MNARAFREAVEKRIIDERETLVLNSRGAELSGHSSPDEAIAPTFYAEEMKARREAVAALRAKGRSQPQIAGILGLTVRQVRHAQGFK